MQKYSLIGGIIIVISSVVMFLTGYGATSGRTTVAVIGLALIAVSRR